MIFYNVGDFYRFIKAGDEKDIVGITSGCFDIIHPLHIEYLKRCSKHCKDLYVLIDSDDLILRSKGKLPIFNQTDRSLIVSSLSCVRGVMVFESGLELKEIITNIPIGKYPIQVYKNSEKIYGKPLYKYGPHTENIIIPDVERFSSSTEIKKH